MIRWTIEQGNNGDKPQPLTLTVDDDKEAGITISYDAFITVVSTCMVEYSTGTGLERILDDPEEIEAWAVSTLKDITATVLKTLERLGIAIDEAPPEDE